MYPVRRKSLIIGLMIAVLTVSAAAASTSREEMTVRSTYAKAMMAYEIEQMSPLLYGAKDSLAKPEHLQIDVSTVTVGPIQDILQTNIEDLVTKPAGYVLDAALVTADIPGTAGKSFKSLSAPQWNVTPLLAQNWAIPLSQDLEATGKDFLSRYASFGVTLTFMGRQRQYKALFLFGQDGNGKTQVTALDFILGVSAVNQLVNAPIQQELQFLQQRFADQPRVQSLLQMSQPQPGCEADSQSQFCCNSLTGRCGVQGLAPVSKSNASSPLLGSSTLSSSSSVAPPSASCMAPACSAYNSSGSPRTLSASGNKAHQTGAHFGSGTATGRCFYSGTALPCVPTCHVEIGGVSTQDTGAVNGAPYYYHQLSWDRGSPDGTNNCTGDLGFGGIQCLHLTACSISVSVGYQGVSVSPVSQVVWEKDLPSSWQCTTIQ